MSCKTNLLHEIENFSHFLIHSNYFINRLERKKRDKEEQVAYKLEQEIALWDPTAAPDDAVTTDPFKTLFVGRINYYTSENKIRREFESYGPIKTIKMVHDKDSGKPKGYCFIEFEHERDMHCKYTKFSLSENMIKTYSRIVLGSNLDCKCKFHRLGKIIVILKSIKIFSALFILNSLHIINRRNQCLKIISI